MCHSNKIEFGLPQPSLFGVHPSDRASGSAGFVEATD
jgi:hypothetical protein